MAITLEQFQQILAQFPNDVAHHIFAGSNLTLPQFLSGNRNNMFCQHLEHHLPPINPEPMNMATTYEKIYGKYTDSYKVANTDYLVIAVIPKFTHLGRFKYLYIVQDIVTKVYDVISVCHYECMNENRGYLRPYTEGDEFKEGQIIRKGTTIFRSNNHDEYGNYRYGLSPKVIAISLPDTEEDGVPISESFYERGSFYTFRTVPISLNKNQILLNYYGNDVFYKCIPDLGEKIKDNILYVKRNINYANIAAELTDNALKTIVSGDDICYGEGYVADIDIWVNDPSEFENCPNKAQLFNYYSMIYQYHQKIYSILGDIVNSSNKSIQYTPILRWIFEHSRNYLDGNIQWVNNNNNFEFAHINIVIYEKKNIFNGFKITDRHGGKNIITKVIPDKYMPRDEYGNVADIVVSPPSMPARMNPGQTHEPEYNFILDTVTKRMLKLPTLEEKEDLLLSIITDSNPKEGAYLRKWLKRASLEQKINMFKDIEMYGPILVEEPFGGTISLENIEMLYKKYSVKPSKITMFQVFKDPLTSLPIENKQTITETVDEKTGMTYFQAQQLLNPGDFVDPTLFAQNEKTLKHKIGVTPFDFENTDDEYITVSPEIYPEQNENGDIQFKAMSARESMNKALDFKNIFNLEDSSDYKPVRAFFNEEGFLVRQYQSFNTAVIGRKYCMILKQIPDEKFSARSLGTINQICVPNKPGKQSNAMLPFSKNSIRLGNMENDNLFTRMDPLLVHRFFAAQSVNPELREKLATMLLTKDPTQSHNLDIESEDIIDDAPAILFHVALFSIGIEITPIYEEIEEEVDDDDSI